MFIRNDHLTSAGETPKPTRHAALSFEEACLLQKSLGPMKKLVAASHPSSPNRDFAKKTVDELERKLVAMVARPVPGIQKLSLDYNELLMIQTSLCIYALQSCIEAPACALLRRKLTSPTGPYAIQ